MDEEYIYLLRKRKKFWGSSRYEFTIFDTLGRARGAAKSSIRQGGQHLEPQMIIRVAKSAMEEIEEIT